MILDDEEGYKESVEMSNVLASQEPIAADELTAGYLFLIVVNGY